MESLQGCSYKDWDVMGLFIAGQGGRVEERVRIQICPLNSKTPNPKWEFPEEIRGTFLGGTYKRTIVFGGLYWGPPLFWETTKS